MGPGGTGKERVLFHDIDTEQDTGDGSPVLIQRGKFDGLLCGCCLRRWKCTHMKKGLNGSM